MSTLVNLITVLFLSALVGAMWLPNTCDDRMSIFRCGASRLYVVLSMNGPYLTIICSIGCSICVLLFKFALCGVI